MTIENSLERLVTLARRHLALGHSSAEDRQAVNMAEDFLTNHILSHDSDSPAVDFARDEAVRFLRSAGDPAADFLEAFLEGRLKLASHEHREGVTPYLVVIPKGEQEVVLEDALFEHDPSTFEFDKGDEFVTDISLDLGLWTDRIELRD